MKKIVTKFSSVIFVPENDETNANVTSKGICKIDENGVYKSNNFVVKSNETRILF